MPVSRVRKEDCLVLTVIDLFIKMTLAIQGIQNFLNSHRLLKDKSQTETCSSSVIVYLRKWYHHPLTYSYQKPKSHPHLLLQESSSSPPFPSSPSFNQSTEPINSTSCLLNLSSSSTQVSPPIEFCYWDGILKGSLSPMLAPCKSISTVQAKRAFLSEKWLMPPRQL